MKMIDKILDLQVEMKCFLSSSNEITVQFDEPLNDLASPREKKSKQKQMEMLLKQLTKLIHSQFSGIAQDLKGEIEMTEEETKLLNAYDPKNP